jgi:hypothetical protein
MSSTGFSTGAIAQSDFATALRLLEPLDAEAVELSALRLAELEPLVDALNAIDLRRYEHVALHAPSSFLPEEEHQVITLLKRVADRGYLVVVHPDVMHELPAWRVLGDRLCIENMDKRKSTGRTVAELRLYFDQLPEASFCFDIAHARQVDASMMVAFRLLREFGARIRQVHISEVDTGSRHARMSPSAADDYAQVLRHVPPQAAFIIEAQVPSDQLAVELAAVRQLRAGIGRQVAFA